MITPSRLSELRQQRDAIAAEQERQRAAEAQARADRVTAAQNLGFRLASEHFTFDEIKRVNNLMGRDRPAALLFASLRGALNDVIPRYVALRPMVDEILDGGLRSGDELEAFITGVRQVLSAVVEE